MNDFCLNPRVTNRVMFYETCSPTFYKAYYTYPFFIVLF